MAGGAGEWMVAGVVRAASPDRIRAYAGLMLVTVLLGGVAYAVLDLLHAERVGNGIGGDYLAFYTGGRFLLDGRLDDVYDPAAQRVFQEAVVAPRPLAIKPFIHPPHAAILFAPFSALPFRAGLVLWWLTGVGALWLSAWLLRDALPSLRSRGTATLVGASLCFFPTLAWLAFGQATGLMLLALTAGFALLRRGRDGAAGACLGCLALKPQLALAIAVVLVIRGRWRAVAAAGAVVLGWVALGYLASPAAVQDYLAIGPQLLDTLRSDAYPGYGSHSVMGFAALLLHAWAPVLVDPVTALVTLGLLGVLARSWSRIPWQPGSRRWDLAMAASLAWGVVLSPHLHFYDLALLLLPFAIVCHQQPGLREGRPLDGGPLLAASVAVWLLAFAGTPLSLLQLRVTALLGVPAVALQLSTLAVLGWGALALRAAERET